MPDRPLRREGRLGGQLVGGPRRGGTADADDSLGNRDLPSLRDRGRGDVDSFTAPVPGTECPMSIVHLDEVMGEGMWPPRCPRTPPSPTPEVLPDILR